MRKVKPEADHLCENNKSYNATRASQKIENFDWWLNKTNANLLRHGLAQTKR